MRQSTRSAFILAGLWLALALPTLAAADPPVPLHGMVTGQAVSNPTSDPAVVAVTFTGAGQATPLGPVSVLAQYSLNTMVFPTKLAVHNGSMLFTGPNGDSLSGVFSGQATPTQTPGVLTLVASAQVTGGTGRFLGALGIFTATATVNLQTDEISASFDGTISAPGMPVTTPRAPEAGLRWDIVSLPSFSPVTIQPGGQASAVTFSDGSKLTLTGSGTFVPTQPDEVTGGGTWVTFDPSGAPEASGTFQVAELLQWNERLGSLPASFVDKIGRQEDFVPGQAFLRIAYSDGSRGILILASRANLAALPPGAQTAAVAPPTRVTWIGITASKDDDYYGSRLEPQPMVDGNRVAFHTVTLP